MKRGPYMTKKLAALRERTPVIAYGGGVNSVALCLLLIEQKQRVDHILFSDTGGEKPGTYDYNQMFSDYLSSQGWPNIVRLPVYKSGGLYMDCISNKRMPSIVYGFKTCSEVWKRRPFVKYCNEHSLWPITTFKGFDAGEDYRLKPDMEAREHLVFPLVEADMDRDDCKKMILRHGLPLPPKSACFFCPASSPEEVRALPKELLQKAIEMEKNARKTEGGAIRGLGYRHKWEDWAKVQTLFDLPERSAVRPCMVCHD